MPFDAMEAKNFDLKILTDKDSPPTLQLAAARGYGEKKWLSGIMTVLPTQGVPETQQMFAATMQDAQHDLEVLSRYINRNDSADNADAKAMALQWRNTLAVAGEAAENLARQTAEIPVDANGNPGATFPGMNDGDEAGDDPNVRASAAVRGVFVHFPFAHGECREQAFSMAVDCGGCAVVVKERRGLQLRLVLRCLPIVTEPWTPRQTIVNRYVWVLEWVPAQFIKTITQKCGCEGGMKIEKRVVLDRGMIGFWRCL